MEIMITVKQYKKYCCYYKNIDSYEDFVIRKDDTALAKRMINLQ